MNGQCAGKFPNVDELPFSPNVRSGAAFINEFIKNFGLYSRWQVVFKTEQRANSEINIQ